MLVGLGGAELLVTHLILLHWSRTAAFVLSALTLAGIAWFAAAVASLRHRPVLLTDEALMWRLGRLKTVRVPRDAVGGLREGWDAAALKAPGTVNFAGRPIRMCWSTSSVRCGGVVARSSRSPTGWTTRPRSPPRRRRGG